MNRVRSFLTVVGGAISSFAGMAGRQIGLVPSYLSHLLWLVDTKFLSLAKEAYGGNPAVYASLRLLSNAVGEPPLIAYTRLPDGEPGDPLPWDHPLRMLIRNPNPFLTEFEHAEIRTMHRAICGRYTAWKERNLRGEVIAIWPLRPDRVAPIYGDPTQGEPPVIGWSYNIPGTGNYLGIPAADIMLSNFPDPAGETGGLVEGLGPLQVLAAEISADLEATRFVGTLLANHAQPLTVIQSKRTIASRQEQLEIKAGFMADFGGSRRGEPAVIDADSTIASVGFSLQQLEFPELRKVSESRIAAALGVPAILVGLMVGLSQGIKATTDELRALFAETTLPSYWRRDEEMFTNDLAVEYGSNIVCKHDLSKVRALAGQANENFSKLENAYQNGALTRGEYREALGYQARPEDDVYVYGIGKGRGVEVETPPGGEPTPSAEDSNVSSSVDPTATTDNAAATRALHEWRSIALSAITSGQTPEYQDGVIHPAIRMAVESAIAAAETPEDIDAVFDMALADVAR